LKKKLTEIANSGIGSGNLYSTALVACCFVDEKGKVATFLFTEGNEKVWLHLVVVWEKHREGIEEEEEEDEGMKKGARHKAEEAIVQKPSCCSLSASSIKYSFLIINFKNYCIFLL
jgi:hypothetical protein